MGLIKKHKQRAIGLLEILIVVAIIGIMAAVALPAFQTYVFTSKEAEATKLLMAAHREQQELKQIYGKYSFQFEGPTTSESAPNMKFRVASRPTFNLVLGDSGSGSGAAFGFHQIYSDYSLPYSNNQYGQALDLDGQQTRPDPSRFLLGAEANLDGDDFLHIVAIDENGILMRVCDEKSNSPSPTANALFAGYGLGNPSCRVEQQDREDDSDSDGAPRGGQGRH